MNKKWMKSVLAATALCCTVGLFGCSSQASETAKNEDGVIELTYWYSWQDKIAENNLELTEKFNETVGKEKGIHVTAEYQGTYEELHSKLQSAFVAGEEPAISVMEIASIRTFAEAGMLQPLDTYISDEKEANFLPGLMDNSYVNDQLYGVPYLRSTPIFYYNKTLFDQAGITSAPTNWEELAEASKKLASIGVAGWGIVNDEWHFEALTKGNGGNTVSDDETEAVFNQAAALAAVQFVDDGLANSNFKYYSGNNASTNLETEFMNQKVAMWIGSTGSLNNQLDIASQNGYEIGTCFIPCGKEYNVPTGGCNLVMTSKLSDEEKTAAAEFINFMTDEDQVVYSHKKTGYLPTTTTSLENPEIIALYQQTPQFKVALDQLQYGSGRPMNKGYNEGIKFYKNALDKIFTSDVDIQSTLDEAAKECTAVLQENA